MKIYKKYIKSFVSLSLSVVMLSACTSNFDEINTNNNAPVAVSPGLLLPTATESLVDRLYGTAYGVDVALIWSQQWAKIQYTDEDRYEVRGTTLTNTWDGFYVGPVTDFTEIEKLAVEAGHVNFEAVALTMRALTYATLTEAYGDIPVSEAVNAEITQPVYDSQEAVYDRILADLGKAYGLFDAAALPLSGDILLEGDIAHWKKFCNSLRMRYMMRVSGATSKYASDLNAIIAGGDYITSNDENVMLHYLADAPKNNPVAENRKTRDDHRASENIVAMTGANAGTDARATIYMDVVPDDGGGYIGVPNGIVSSEAIAYGLSATSKVGEFFTGYDETTGTVLTGAIPAMLISAAEVDLIRAEAALSGSGEDAETMYINAITNSFNYYEAALTATINTDRTDGWAYDYDHAGEIAWYLGETPYDAANARQVIATEKYKVLFGQGHEAWTEYRRTGFPVLTPGKDAVIDEVPSRLPYPAGEQSLNKTNYDAAIARQGADKLATKLWFMK